jgi:hypothetical protein
MVRGIVDDVENIELNSEETDTFQTEKPEKYDFKNKFSDRNVK